MLLSFHQIKDTLLKEKNKMEATERRKKEKHDKKFAKQVHSERLQVRAKEKREALNELDAMKRKGDCCKLSWLAWATGMLVDLNNIYFSSCA